MPHLARPIEELRAHYEVVVVGSGYGGGVAAARLARAGRDVCVLERGREFLPGDFPTDGAGLREEVQTQASGRVDLRHVGDPRALFDLRVGRDISVVVGCGVGGTSLINAGVCLWPEPRVFADPRWPRALREDLEGGLAAGRARAEAMLRPRTYPEDAPTPGKLRALEEGARRLGRPFVRLPLAVTFTDEIAPTGARRRACKACGECVTGCNHGAKSTVADTYLVDAHNHGAAIFAEVSVLRVAQHGWRWRVYFDAPGYGRDVFEAPPMAITADVVILAAGTLGSTEILLRSRAAGLSLSPRLGERFSGNGDVIGFGYNTATKVDALGWGAASEGPPVGPLLTSMIDRSGQERLEDGKVIQDGAIPGALVGLARVGLAAVARALGEDDRQGLGDRLRGLGREVADVVGDDDGALAHTTTYIVTSHDDSGGVLDLDDDRVRISWPHVGLSREVEGIYAELRDLVGELRGAFVPNPLWTELTDNALVTVHPLGGAVMADDAGAGVVDERGRVFSGAAGDGVYDGLYVCDGAIIPRSLGANPLLTIAALAERQVALLAEDRGWRIAEGWPDARPPEPVDPPVGVAFTEAMRGAISVGELEDYREGARRGEAEGSTFECLLTVFSRDLAALERDPNHRSGMIGSVLAPALSTRPLTVVDGAFDLFADDLSAADTRNLRYRAQLHAEDGRVFYLYGFKVVHDDRGFDLWSDMTTLFTTIHEGPSEAGPVVGKGVLRVLLADFLRQLRTLRVLGRDLDAATRARALVEFGGRFGYALLDTYADFIGGGSKGPISAR